MAHKIDHYSDVLERLYVLRDSEDAVIKAIVHMQGIFALHVTDGKHNIVESFSTERDRELFVKDAIVEKLINKVRYQVDMEAMARKSRKF